MIELATRIYFFYSAAWHECLDVLPDPPPTWYSGMASNGILDLVAGTGIASFTLDNSPANAAKLAGYYSPGNPNHPAWFAEDLKLELRVEYPSTVFTKRFCGSIANIDPTAGLFKQDTVEVEVRDWMDLTSIQKIGQQPIQANKRVDQALTTLLTAFAIQPPGGSNFDTGKQTFAQVFNTDSPSDSMATVFQKFARNELGRIFLKGNGTLRFENRHARLLNPTSAFTLNSTMSELDVRNVRDDIKNVVRTKIYPARVDGAATTVIWQLQQPIYLGPGQVFVITAEFRDPATGTKISAADVVDPLVSGTHITFGSVSGGGNELIANLTYPMIVGGNSAAITLTNTSASIGGYVNILKILGRGIYTYEPMSFEARDAASVTARGERPLPINLEQCIDPNFANGYAYLIKGQLANPFSKIEKVRFLVNQSDALILAALAAEVSTRFTLVEDITGTSADFFVQQLKYEQVGPQLWLEIIPAPAATGNYFIWDNTEVDGDGHHIHGWDHGALVL